MGSGTAWVIDCRPNGVLFDVTFATASHFTTEDNPPPYAITFPDGTILFEDDPLVRNHPTEDFALITFRSSSYHAPLSLDPRVLEYGEPLTLDGYPAGLGPFQRSGHSGGDSRTSAPAWQGDSGGAITDEDGEVVGILITVTSPDGFHLITFAADMTRLVDINEWLQEQLNTEGPL